MAIIIQGLDINDNGVKVVEVGAGSKDYGNLVQVVMGTEIASRSML